MSIEPEQSIAARGLLRMRNVAEVAKYCGVSDVSYRQFESGRRGVGKDKIERARRFFENRGIEFIGHTGVNRQDSKSLLLKGQDGFHLFMDDVYETIAEHGGEICVSNVDERNWIKWMGGQEAYDAHAVRMNTLHNYNFKIMVCEGDRFFIASEIGQYKWVPKEKFTTQSFYAYGDKLAIINFAEEEATINILSMHGCADGFRYTFNLLWDVMPEIPNDE